MRFGVSRMWRTGRLGSWFLLLGVFCVAGESSSVLSQTADEARQAFQEGRYEQAEQAFREVLDAGQAFPVLVRPWVLTLSRLGRTSDALAEAHRFRERTGSAELLTTLGRLQYQLGELEAAEESFLTAIRERASESRTAELHLAILLFDRGDVDEALKRFDGFIDVYNRSSSMSAQDLVAVGVACRYLAVTNPQLLHDALKAFDEAWAQDSSLYEAQIRAGELFLQTYDSARAAESLEKVIAKDPNHPDALLGMARVASFNGSADAMEIVDRLLEVNPESVPARVFKSELLLGLEDYDEARGEADTALQSNPTSLEALTVLAASEMLQGRSDGFRAVRDRVFSRNPLYSEFYNDLAEISVNNRLYRQARDFAEQAVSLDSRSWRGYGLLGLNQLRLGEIDAARENLDRSFEGDPYNVWVKNTLDLMDTYPNFETVETERFEIFAAKQEVALLTPYVERIGDEAYERLAERYGFRPELPIRIELYDSHADFSVRTIGLAGLGALGVCFGNVVVVDSPTARAKGAFNWASTLWHELAHTFTLGVTDHRVPRWFSEGLSVLEERRARPGWGDDINLSFLAAYQQEKLLPLGELNNGFVRPSFPQQIGISYYQASLICELIEREFGFEAIRKMLRGFKDGKTTEVIVREVLLMDFEAFDEKFEAYLLERFGEISKRVKLGEDDSISLTPEQMAQRATDKDDFIAQLKFGETLFQQDDLEQAKSFLERARDLFPDYGGPDAPYRYLAEIYEKEGDLDKAAQALSRFVDINENDYEAHVKLAALHQQLSDSEKAAAILRRAVYIYPFDPAPHQELATLYRRLEDRSEVVTERRALVALNRVDPAQAHYDLARAYQEAGRLREARRSVLRSLELAPAFKAGLDLLRQIRSEMEGS